MQQQRSRPALQERDLGVDVMRLRAQQRAVRLVEQAGPAQRDVPRLDEVADAGLGVPRPAQVRVVHAVGADADVDEAERIARGQAQEQIPVLDAQPFAPAVDGVQRTVPDQGDRPADGPLPDHRAADAVVGAVQFLVGAVQVAHAAVVQLPAVLVDHDRIADHRALARVRLQVADLGIEAAGQQVVVAGARPQELAVRARRQFVEGRRDAAVLPLHVLDRNVHAMRRHPVGDPRAGAVGRAVIDDDQFLRRVRVLQHAVQAAPHEALVVVRRDQHRDQRRRRAFGYVGRHRHSPPR